jgi:hypothetical protein
MAKYNVTGYLVTPYTVEVEADSAESAEELGVDLLYEDKGIAGDSEFSEFEVHSLGVNK